MITWEYKAKRFIKNIIGVLFNQSSINFNQSGVNFGGSMPQTTWNYKNKS